MNRKLLHLAMAASLAGLAACKESTSAPASLFDTATVTADVAQSAGDAAATSIEFMTGDEVTAAMPAAQAPAFDLFGSVTNSLTISRSRTCYDSTGTVVAGCSPMTSVRKVVTHLTLIGTRSGVDTTTGGAIVTWSGVVHRAADDTVQRNYTGPTETSRTHNGFSTSHDTTSFSNGTISRAHEEAASDSVAGITWNLPRLTNPFPVSGKFIRNVALHTTFTSATQSVTRDLTKRVEVDFPADAQGNVVLKIDAKVCNLNLVTHAVTNCH